MNSSGTVSPDRSSPAAPEHQVRPPRSTQRFWPQPDGSVIATRTEGVSERHVAYPDDERFLADAFGPLVRIARLGARRWAEAVTATTTSSDERFVRTALALAREQGLPWRGSRLHVPQPVVIVLEDGQRRK